MPNGKGKLICIWSPALHGEGCSTLADAVGFGLRLLTGRRVLVLNRSGGLSPMERFIEKDIDIRYTLDHLKIFKENLRIEHIDAYATRINTDLYMIAGPRIDRTITGEGGGFDSVLIRRCLEGFDVVVVDLAAGIREDNRPYLEKADHILAVTTPNEIMLETLLSSRNHEETRRYLLDPSKTTVILNKLYDGWAIERQLARLKQRFGFARAMGVCYDGDALKACCQDRNFYSYLSGRIGRSENLFIRQAADICGFLAEALDIETDAGLQPEKHSFFGRLFRRKYSQSEVRA